MKNTLIVLISLIFLCGCTDEHLRKLEAVVVSAQAEVERSEAAIDKAETALASAEQLAEQLGIERAKPVIEQAKQALEVAKDAREGAQATVDAAGATIAAAKQAQEAGGGTFGVIMAGVIAFLTGGAAALPAIAKAISNGRALVQTVRGLDAARDAIGEAEWKTKIAPSLKAAQDEAVKSTIAHVQAREPKTA